MGGGEKNIFDQLMTLPILRRFQPLFSARREKLLYLFFGGLSFLVSVTTYAAFQNILSFHELVSNLLSWLLTTIFVFETNRRWVFEGERKRGTALARQLLAFYAGRAATLFAEEAILGYFAVYLAFPGVPVKIIAQIVVILLNYIISKKYIFKR